MQTEIAESATSLERVRKDNSGPALTDWQLSRDTWDNWYNARTAEVLRGQGFKQQAENLEKCGRILGYYACGQCGEKREKKLYLCSLSRLCPRCARIRRQKKTAELRQKVERINLRPVDRYKYWFITLTLRTVGRHRWAAEAALKAFTRLWRDLLKVGPDKPVACFRALEFGPKNGNVHLHLLYYGPFLNHKDLKAEWSRLTGSWQVWIEPVEEDDLLGRIGEVLKYITKFSEVSHEDLVKYWRAAPHFMIMSYGLFRENKLSEWSGPLPDGEEQEDEGEGKLIICSVCGASVWLYVHCSDLERGPPI